MAIIIAVILLAVSIIFGLGWLKTYISSAVLMRYLQEKNIPMPNEEEIKRASQWVVSHMIKDVTGGSRKQK